MAKWSGKTRGGAFGYKFFILLIKHTNQKVTYSFMGIVAFYFYLFARNSSIIYYFKEIHGFRGKELRKRVYRNYVLFGQVLVDKIAFMVKPGLRFTFDYEGEGYLREMAASGKGGILIGAHMGNWELAGNLLDRIDTKVNVLMLDAEHENIKALLESYHIVRHFNVIPIRDDYSHLAKIKDALDRNELVVMHGDRFVDGNGVVSVQFMGASARFPIGPLYMASKFNVPVSFVYTLKEKSAHYHFYATKPRVFPYPGNLKTRRDDLAKMVGEYVDSLEEMVRRYPEQWFNYFPFWEGEA
ncbi:MAG: hypothetical protein QM786_11690 [Breznakibacter sp.]